jgi:hypothetical protein
MRNKTMIVILSRLAVATCVLSLLALAVPVQAGDGPLTIARGGLTLTVTPNEKDAGHVLVLRDSRTGRVWTGDAISVSCGSLERMEKTSASSLKLRLLHPQTTQPIERVRHLVSRLRRRYPRSEVQVAETVCIPTRLRQEAAEMLAAECDVTVVVGGAGSNNTRELFATCRRHCPRVFLVQDARGLRPEWFEGARVAGITAGTSTPEDVIAGVEAGLREVAQGGRRW